MGDPIISMLLDPNGPREEPVDMIKISSWSGVKFPPNAKLKHSLGIRHRIDFEFYAKIEIDLKDVDPIIKSLNISVCRTFTEG